MLSSSTDKSIAGMDDFFAIRFPFRRVSFGGGCGTLNCVSGTFWVGNLKLLIELRLLERLLLLKYICSVPHLGKVVFKHKGLPDGNWDTSDRVFVKMASPVRGERLIQLVAKEIPPQLREV
ncbi:hypothetical protein Tco_1532263 [Tanacetum coccineum]